MKYELAKRLKDAGFPQKQCSFLNCRHGMDVDVPCCYNPTLSELIEACGENFIRLDMLTNSHPHKWQALAGNNGGLGAEGKYTGYGSTPEIAVAELWLALNTK